MEQCKWWWWLGSQWQHCQADRRKLWLKYSCRGGHDISIMHSTKICRCSYHDISIMVIIITFTLGDLSFSQITSPDQGSGMQGIWVHAPSINIDIDISNHANPANSIQMQFSELKCVRSYNDVVVSFKTGNETHLDTNGVHGVQCGGFVHLICQQGFLSYCSSQPSMV